MKVWLTIVILKSQNRAGRCVRVARQVRDAYPRGALRQVRHERGVERVELQPLDDDFVEIAIALAARRPGWLINGLAFFLPGLVGYVVAAFTQVG